jgi:diguanylate cyclase (GGDEF)-like protein/PAS domain S-box-containing protein
MINLSANWWALMGGTSRDTSIPIAELIDRVPDGEQADCWSAVRAVLRGSASFYDVEHRVRRDDGTMMWIRSRGSVSARGADGRVVRMSGTNFDITARKIAQLGLQESEAKLRLVADSLPLMVTYLDADLRFLFANRAYLDSFGAALGEVLGRRLGEVAGEEAEELVRARFEELRAGCTVTYEREREEAGGVTRHYEVRIVPRRDGNERLEGMFTVIQDVTERAVTARLFEQLALSDPLTSLPNKRLLLDRIERAIAQAGRRDGFSAILFVDLDGFKAVNDSMGHTEGDRLLKAVGSRLRTCARASDTVARFGGDEFVVLLEGCRTATDAGNIARKMAVALSLPFPLSQGEAEISCSIGIALHPRDGLDPETLLARADAAMYRAKQTGKNRVVLFAEAPA